MNRNAIATVVGVFAAAGMVGSASAQLNTSDTYLYGAGRGYAHVGPAAHFSTPAGFFDIFVDLDLMGPPITGPAPGTVRTDPLSGMGTLRQSLNGLPPGIPWEALAGMSIFTRGTGIGTFDTEMLALNLSGGTMPPGVMIRESPTLQSLGHTTLAPIGGGLFHIDSFFDVFTELSVDGGQSWTPSSSGPARLNITPAPGAAALLGLGGLVAARRRRTTR